MFNDEFKIIEFLYRELMSYFQSSARFPTEKSQPAVAQYDTRKITSAFSKHQKSNLSLKVPSVLKTGGANKGPASDNFLQYIQKYILCCIPKQSIVLVPDSNTGEARCSSSKKAVKKLGDEPVTLEEMRLRLNISTTHHHRNNSYKYTKYSPPPLPYQLIFKQAEPTRLPVTI